MLSLTHRGARPFLRSSGDAGASAPAVYPASDPADVVMWSTSIRTVLEGDAPATAAIEAAIARPAALDAAYGGWLSPCARVVRDAVLPAFVVTVDRPWAFPHALSAANRAEFLSQLGRMLDGALSSVADEHSAAETAARIALGAIALGSSTFAPSRFVPFNTATNGALSWWASGAACDTRTRDAPGTGLDRVRPQDNPAGPNPPSTASALARVAAVVGIAAVATVALVELGPAVRAAAR
jgi:hypothetical protein